MSTLEKRREGFQSALNQIANLALHSTCCQILINLDYAERFFTWPAAKGFHHTHEGGLVDHTLEVLHHALTSAAQIPSVDLDILITAVLWHDVAKIWEYERTGDPEAPWGSTEYARNIYHISGSNAEFVANALAQGVPRATIERVSHAILAHHGPVREWGSPVAPRSVEAVLLHQADMISAHFGATK